MRFDRASMTGDEGDPGWFPDVAPATVRSLPIVIAADLAADTVQPREWLLEGLIPDRTVTLLTGDGGTGKSLLALQLAVAMSAERSSPIGKPKAGSVLFLAAEDDRDELHRRLDAICNAEDIELSELRDLVLIPVAGEDAILAAAEGYSLAPTPLWRSLVITARELRPKLIVLDSLADVFGADENERTHARAFVGMLRRLATEISCAFLVLSHPSAAGMASGNGSSGSTAWSNSVRSRLYLTRNKDDWDRGAPRGKGKMDRSSPRVKGDPDRRVLQVLKANYGATGRSISLRYDNGRFTQDLEQARAPATTVTAEVDDLFLQIVTDLIATGTRMSPKGGPTWAPAKAAKHPDAKNISSKVFEASLRRLLDNGSLEATEVGPPSGKSWLLRLPP